MLIENIKFLQKHHPYILVDCNKFFTRIKFVCKICGYEMSYIPLNKVRNSYCICKNKYHYVYAKIPTLLSMRNNYKINISKSLNIDTLDDVDKKIRFLKKK